MPTLVPAGVGRPIPQGVQHEVDFASTLTRPSRPPGNRWAQEDGLEGKANPAAGDLTARQQHGASRLYERTSWVLAGPDVPRGRSDGGAPAGVKRGSDPTKGSYGLTAPMDPREGVDREIGLFSESWTSSLTELDRTRVLPGRHVVSSVSAELTARLKHVGKWHRIATTRAPGLV